MFSTGSFILHTTNKNSTKHKLEACKLRVIHSKNYFGFLYDVIERWIEINQSVKYCGTDMLFFC